MSIKSPNNITLSDGRKLGFAEFGQRQGKPVFYFHGFPGITTVLYAFPAFFFRNYPERMLSIFSGKVAGPDKIALKNKALIKVLNASFREAFRNSLRWPATDVVLYSRPWGFSLEDIDIPVHLWHGEEDRIVPPEMGRYMARCIPNCRATFFPDEGHFSIILNRIEEIWQIF